MGVTGIALGVCGREHSVHKHEGSDDLSGESGAKAVSGMNEIGATAVVLIERPLKALHKPRTADCSQALCYYVGECSC